MTGHAPQDSRADPKAARTLVDLLGRLQTALDGQSARVVHHLSGLTLVQWRVLAQVSAAGQTRPTEVADQARLDRGLVSRTVKDLVRKGLVRVRRNPKDKRQHLLRLSPDGAAVTAQIFAVLDAQEGRMDAVFAKDELSQVVGALERLEAELSLPQALRS